MPSSPDITELWGNFKNLVKKITYDKTEIDDKLSDKADNNHTHTTLVKSSNIPSGADLNDYTTTGFYLCSYTNTSTLINKPDSVVTGGIRLEVLSQANGVTQIIRAYSKTSVENKMYFRYYYQSEDTWTDWQKVITTLNVDSSLSTSSTNPVQNKVVHQELTNKSDIDHTHELGGTNLISGTQDMSFKNTGVGEEDGEYRGLKVLHTNNTSDRYLDIIKLIYDKNKEYGEYYTLSFWMKGTPKENGVNSYFYSGGVNVQVVKSIDGWTKPYSDGECRFNITSEWRRVWVVYQLETDGTLDTPKSIAIRANAGADVYVAGLKFERGDQPSDWSPAPEDKAPSSHVHSKLVPTSIPESADLNDYTTQGSFKCEMNATAATLTNCPTNKSFHLEVYQHAGVRQVLYTYIDNNSTWAYERNWSGMGSNGNRWDEWRRIPTDLDITSAVGDIQSALDKIIGV